MPPAYENSYAKVEGRTADNGSPIGPSEDRKINTGTIGALAADFDLFRRAGAEDEDSLIIILAVVAVLFSFFWALLPIPRWMSNAMARLLFDSGTGATGGDGETVEVKNGLGVERDERTEFSF